MRCVPQVLAIDRSIFSTLCPKQLVSAVEDARELTFPAARSMQGLNGGAIVKFGVLVLGIGLTFILHLIPQLDVLRAIGSALCGAHTSGHHDAFWAA